MTTHSLDEILGRHELGDYGASLMKKFAVVGVVALCVAGAFGSAANDGFHRLMYAYLTGYMYALSLCVGALFFVILQHLTRSGWSVTVRRIAENIAGNFPLMFVLGLPLVVPVLSGYDGLFHWVNPALTDPTSPQYDELLHHKSPYLNPTFFVVRYLIYFGVWTLLSRHFIKNSRSQDASADLECTKRMERLAAPSMVLFALTTTFCAFDFLMSLDAHWFSTIFGVYFFAGSVMSFFALLGLICMGLQARGYVEKAITVEHYHDIGKLLFGFLFFWGYIAFSQYMLIWYANIPEESEWFLKRQESTGWIIVTLAILFLHFVVPYFFLLSRATKRNKLSLAFFSAWLLVMHAVDIFWLIMPNYDVHHVAAGPMEVAALVGLFCVLMAATARRASTAPLVPYKDPRLEEALAFENF